MLESTARHSRVDVDLGVVIREDRGGDRREVALRGVGRLEDLVSELELDRATQSGELAFRCPSPNEIVERIEQGLFVQRGERVPVA